VPLPVPVTVVPSISVSVHAPVAVIVPDIVVLAPLQIVVEALVIAAAGRVFTKTVKVCGAPLHPFNDGVTVTVAVTGDEVLFTAINEAISPVPLAANPIVGDTKV
jgi:hypothetical protein